MQITEIHLSLRAAIDDAIARALAVGGLIGVAVIHMLQIPDAFEEIGYLGALFIAVVAGCVLLACALARTSDDRVWLAAAVLPALVLIGYLLSRSVGLPGFTSDMGEWAEPPGLVAMVAESMLIVLSTGVLAGRRAFAPDDGRAAPARAATPSSAERPAW